jgi:hypothetical protein
MQLVCQRLRPLLPVKKDLENEASNVAKLLISCRAVIAQNEGLFNNPEIG